MLAVVLACTTSCRRNDSPHVTYNRAYQSFLRGDLEQCQEQAERARSRFLRSRPDWAWKFRILEAEATLWRGLYDEVPRRLQGPAPPPDQPESAVSALTLTGLANAYLHNFDEAERAIQQAEQACSLSTYPNCGEVIEARGILASQKGLYDPAEQFFRRSLSFFRAHHNAFHESTSLLNLGAMALAQGHFDEAIDQSEAGYQVAHTIGARIVELVTKGNVGWAFYKLGDREQALDLSLQSANLASELHDVSDQENYLTNVGYVQMDARKFDLAEQSFRQALALAEGIKAQEDIYNTLRVLARLSLQVGDLAKADEYTKHAFDIARESKNRVNELYPLLVQGQVAARRGDSRNAWKTFRAVEQDENCPVSLKWEAQHSLARLFEDENQPDAAEREYRAALATFEAARNTVKHEDSHLSFLTNAARIYDDYVHFLVARGKTEQALRWADFSRARTLAEGLGLLSKQASLEPPPLNAPQIARRAGGTLLFYWLGEKQSYLWVITTRKTVLYSLPVAPEIDATVRGYRDALNGPEDVLASRDPDGLSLYRMLIAPAQDVLPRDGKIYIIPDGSLNNLNFETLLVDVQGVHYWIEDATIVNASSLRLLAAAPTPRKKPARNLLLIGNSIAPSGKYPELPKAALQIQSVAQHFAESSRQVLTRAQATPAAYLESKPEQFSHIHFVAHGTASRLSPLDSAIVLSKNSTQDDSFKLYARDIIRHPVQADLVTISACYGAEGRTYSGEGLVGLSWAFLKAGAHNVVAALWEATDASTEMLMSRFYDELDKGAKPDAALRTAKLSLLRQTNFRSPFYWAPFQLYVGSYATPNRRRGPSIPEIALSRTFSR